MAAALERVGYRVIQAKNGVEARERFDETVDLLLTDIRMPYVNGDELIEALRGRRRSLKVLAFSGYPAGSTHSDVVFLSKPFVREELLAAVEAALAR